MILRREQDGDRAAVRAVHAAAFARPDGRLATEVQLVDGLRDDGDVIAGLSIVAEQDTEVVGHVVCSRGALDGWPAVGLGPLGVDPRHQRRGVGHALMHGVLAAAEALDEPCVLVLGDAAYYARFGFERAAAANVHPADPAWTEHFQLRRLTAWSGTLTGTFRYAAAFDRLEVVRFRRRDP